MIVVVCDNGGFAVISRLQVAKGTPGFNNLLKDSRILDREHFPHVDWAAHARSMGAEARHCESLADLEAALEWAKTTDRTTVISIATDAYAWVPGDADWDVGVPEVSNKATVREARAQQDRIRASQRVGV
jgi:3D-(3,5/4)-trihydroxycyclohexane-1,2-dione acylhydrolase (decyclizing)